MDQLVVILRLVFATGMLILPGYLVGRLAGVKAKIWLAFPLSVVILFSCIFSLHACGLILTFGDVAAIEIVICVAVAIFIRIRHTRESRGVPAAPSIDHKTGWDNLCVGLAVLAGAIFFWRYLHAPLMGFDTYFRWDFLAEQILKFGRYDFYPPRMADDFRRYFYVDAIPPAVSFSYWWVYAAAGAHWPKLTVIPVTLQYISALGLVYEATRNLAGNVAGGFAVAALASSSHFFTSVAIGQETGLTAVSLAGVICLTLVESPSLGACAIAGMMAALAALSREYGWAFLLCGAIPLLHARRPFKRLCVFLLVGIIFAGPWYIRTWLLTGNPFYSMSFLGLPVNPVLAAQRKYLEQYLAVTHWSADQAFSVLLVLFKFSFVQWTIGLCALAFLLKKSRLLAGMTLTLSFILVLVIWLYSVGQTDGGPSYSTRVLAPATVVLSIAAGMAFARVRPRWLLQLLLLGALAYALLCAWVYPLTLDNTPPSYWLEAGVQEQQLPRPQTMHALLSEQRFPLRARILSSDASLYVALLPDCFVTPIWSPEVRFIFDPQIGAAEIRRRLFAQGIIATDYSFNSIATVFLAQHSNLFADIASHSRSYRTIIHTQGRAILAN